MRDIKQKILKNQYPGMRLPDERTLSEDYGVSRSSIKRALGVLAQQGIIFKKRGSGTFINPLYLKNRSLFHYEGSNLGVTDSFQLDGKSRVSSCLTIRWCRPILMFRRSSSLMIMILSTKSNGCG